MGVALEDRRECAHYPAMISFLRFPGMLALGLMSFAGAFANERQPILIVLTNHAQLGDTGKPTGFFLSEAAHPWTVFTEAGYPVVLASPEGGFAPVDPKSLDLEDEANARFWARFGGAQGPAGATGVAGTAPLVGLRAEDHAAVFFAGGHGAVWDFPGNAALQKLAVAIYERGGAVGAVCHGPAALVNLKLADGSPLVKGRNVAAFTNAEEEAVKLTAVVPFLLEDALAAAGARIVPADNFRENAVRDGRLVTGQNPASATLSARLLIEALSTVTQPQAHIFKDSGEIPNSVLPLLIYPQAVPADADAIEAMMRKNGWRPAWRYSVYTYPHYHTTAHEFLGVYRGSARIRLGHTTGGVFEVKAGDVIVIPAGVGHQNLGASDDFHVVGGYPPGQSADQMRGRPGERPAADERIARVPLPDTDPVHGEGGPLIRLWRGDGASPSR